jgi:transposase
MGLHRGLNRYLAKKIDKRAIAKLLDVSPNTLYAWLKVRRPQAADAITDTPAPDMAHITL